MKDFRAVRDEHFKKHFEVGDSIFNGFFDSCRSELNNAVDSTFKNLYSFEKYGLITSAERNELVNFASAYSQGIINKYQDAYAELVGEDEYNIQWFMYRHNATREKAKAFFENDY